MKKLGAHMESTQSRVQSESVTARRPVDDDLDNYFYYNDLERHIF